MAEQINQKIKVVDRVLSFVEKCFQISIDSLVHIGMMILLHLVGFLHHRAIQI